MNLSGLVRRHVRFVVLPVVFLLGLASLLGSGGGGGGSGSSGGGTTTYTIGGTVTGLSGSGLVLQDNGGDNLNVSGNGTFTFAASMSSNSGYAVTVLTEPSSPTQTCVVTSGSGTVASSNVTNVAINCTTNTYTIGGTVSGLSGSGLVLQDNGGDNLSVSANGTFTFATHIASGASYSASVLTNPSTPNQTCVVTSGSGTVSSSNVTGVSVSCSMNSATYGYYVGSRSSTSSIAGLYSVNYSSPGSRSVVDANALYAPGLGTVSVVSPVTYMQTNYIYAGTFDVATGTLGKATPYAVVFFSGGNLYKDYSTGGAPVRVSSESSVGSGIGDGSVNATTTDLCGTLPFTDFANPENTILVYRLAGTDKTCGTGDDVLKWTSLSAASGTAPTVATVTPIAPVYDNTGAITNVIVLNGSGALVKLDQNIGGTATVISAGPYSNAAAQYNSATKGPSLSTTKILLLVQPSGSSNAQFRIVDANADILTSSLGTVTLPNPSAGVPIECDSTYCYYVDTQGASPLPTQIQRFPVDGSSSASIFSTSADGQILFFLAQTANSVIYGGFNQPNHLYSAPKSGAPVVTLATANAGESVNYWGVSSNGYVYISRYSATLSAQRAHAVKDDGTGLVTFGGTNGAMWAVTGSPTTQHIFLADAHCCDTSLLMLVEYAAAATDLGGATLSVVDATTAAKNGISLGTGPSGFTSILGFATTTGNNGLVWSQQTGNPMNMFYVDLTANNSLTRSSSDAFNDLFIY